MSPRSRYFCSHARTNGNVRSQLMHVYVQKTYRTTRPRSWSGPNGAELSHPVTPSSDGATPRSDKWDCRRKLTVLLLTHEGEKEEEHVEDVEEDRCGKQRSAPHVLRPAQLLEVERD